MTDRQVRDEAVTLFLAGHAAARSTERVAVLDGAADRVARELGDPDRAPDAPELFPVLWAITSAWSPAYTYWEAWTIIATCTARARSSAQRVPGRLP